MEDSLLKKTSQRVMHTDKYFPCGVWPMAASCSGSELIDSDAPPAGGDKTIGAKLQKTVQRSTFVPV